MDLLVAAKKQNFHEPTHYVESYVICKVFSVMRAPILVFFDIPSYNMFSARWWDAEVLHE